MNKNRSQVCKKLKKRRDRQRRSRNREWLAEVYLLIQNKNYPLVRMKVNSVIPSCVMVGNMTIYTLMRVFNMRGLNDGVRLILIWLYMFKGVYDER